MLADILLLPRLLRLSPAFSCTSHPLVNHTLLSASADGQRGDDADDEEEEEDGEGGREREREEAGLLVRKEGADGAEEEEVNEGGSEGP
eukprot:909802-Rhodomonas_salina.1